MNGTVTVPSTVSSGLPPSMTTTMLGGGAAGGDGGDKIGWLGGGGRLGAETTKNWRYGSGVTLPSSSITHM